MSHLEANLHSEMPLSEESLESDAELLPGRDPYEPPKSEPLEVEDIFENDELKAYVYENTDYYLSQWPNQSYRSTNRSYGFNWAAFFLTGLWMAYRKMYWQFLALLGATIALSLVEQTLAISQAWVSTLAISLVCGFFGNKWYHNHALRVVHKTRLKEPRADKRIEMLYKRGKKTKPKVLISVIAIIFIAFLIYTLVTP